MVLEDQPSVEHVDHFMHILAGVLAGLTQLNMEGTRCTAAMDMAAMVALLEDQLQATHGDLGPMNIVITQDIKLQ
jgi:hypothetical protein